ncbi:ATP-binding cassette domain-containing protein [Phaeobacter sp. PT47_59]|uniref:amino acid ABC transporter ATP-binding/permease protein n=1 Tax=Phaeobacter sp. PT47_59 TaxID=3029979 RepID=UPI00238034E1|nr:ATP-binding cassette domain-containing protein [Phaeobacter sp. PT47_59]MDE4176518.1 ATP-binding cassette domain-containing protein [Phaeobacter sp. PT47_59]
MSALFRLILMVVRDERAALWRGLALSVAVLAMGTALLGLSGWFIIASAAAGMAGLGILFNVFVPSAMVRFLALGRTAARYGERVLTHDATLRALSGLRLRLLIGLSQAPHRQIERLRANTELNRITADTDALDGALLRLVLPVLAGSISILGATVILWVLVHPSVALVIGGGYLILPTAVFFIGQRLARGPARQAEAALQAGRSRLIDLISGRDDLTVYGQLQRTARTVNHAFERHTRARQSLDRVERRAGAWLDLMGGGITAATLGLGIFLVQSGDITVASAAIALFVALALGEAVAPVRRALAEIGRMTHAARRVLPALGEELDPDDEVGGLLTGDRAGDLVFDAVTLARGTPIFAPLSFSVGPGETLVLTGPSGSGKSTVLLLAAGALRPTAGRLLYGGQAPADLPLGDVTRDTVLVPQRHALITGSIAENLRLAAPDADDETLWQALEDTCLADTLRQRAGLQTWLGFRGAGLSGGEARRLVLARAILRQPRLLLLDEPTEGLDDEMARAVMLGIRRACPEAAILIAAHRKAEIESADRICKLRSS